MARAPHNLYAHTSQLLAEAPGASTAHDIGFRFGPAPSGGRAMTSFSVSYPAAKFTFPSPPHRDMPGYGSQPAALVMRWHDAREYQPS